MRPAPDVAWVLDDDVAYLARLPHGPIVALEGTAGLIWSELTAVGDRSDIVDRVRAHLADPPGDLDALVEAFVAELAADGWVVDRARRM